MQTSPRTLSEQAAPALGGRCIQVRWTAVIATAETAGTSGMAARRSHENTPATNRHVEFVISLETVDARHTLFEAWLETPTGLREIVPRRPVGCTVSSDDGLLHVDVTEDDSRVLALTVRDSDDPASRRNGAAPRELLYAQSALLADAGLAPAACDPPTARLVELERDAASA